MKVLLALACACLLVAWVATPAMATHTVLCKKNEEICAKGNTYPTSEFALELTGFVGREGSYLELKLSGLTTLTCSSEKFGTVLKEQKEGPMTGEVGRFPFFSPCTPSGCTITTSPAEPPMGYAAELEAVGGGDGVLRVSKPTLIATCTSFPLFLNCTYSTETMLVNVEGGGEKEGEHGYLTTEAPLSPITGFGCTKTATFRSHYEIYEPGESLYVTN